MKILKRKRQVQKEVEKLKATLAKAELQKRKKRKSISRGHEATRGKECKEVPTASPRCEDNKQQRINCVGSEHDCSGAQSSGTNLHSSYSTASLDSSSCSSGVATASGDKVTRTGKDGSRAFSSKGLADLVRNSPDPHSPIWLPALNYPVQYCVRQTRSMSQSAPPHTTLVDIELPSSRRWKGRTKDSAKHLLVKEAFDSSHKDSSVNEDQLCHQDSRICGTPKTVKKCATMHSHIGDIKLYPCALRTPGAPIECGHEAWASSCEVPAIQLQVQWSSEEVSEPVTSEPVTAVAAVCGRPCDDGCACQHMCCMVGTQLMLWSMGDCNCVQCSLQGCRGNWKLNGQWKQIARVTLAKEDRLDAVHIVDSRSATFIVAAGQFSSPPSVIRCFCVSSDPDQVWSTDYSVQDTPCYCCSTLLPSGKEELNGPLTAVAFTSGEGLCKIALASVCYSSRCFNEVWCASVPDGEGITSLAYVECAENPAPCPTHLILSTTHTRMHMWDSQTGHLLQSIMLSCGGPSAQRALQPLCLWARKEQESVFCLLTYKPHLDTGECGWADDHPPVGWLLALPALRNSEYQYCQVVACFKQLSQSDRCVVVDSCGLPYPGIFCQASSSSVHLWMASTLEDYRQLSVDVEGLRITSLAACGSSIWAGTEGGQLLLIHLPT